MNRRKFLSASVGFSVLSVGLSGCSSLGSSQSNEHIETARDALSENEETFQSYNEQLENGETPNLDAEQIRLRVDRANEALDDAEDDASDEQIEQIEALRAWGDFQMERADGFELSIRFTSKWETVSAHLDSEQYSQAKTALGELSGLHADLKTKIGEIEAAYDEVSRSALADGGLEAYHDQITNWLSNIREWLEVTKILLDGIDPLLTGLLIYKEGANAYQNENYSKAVEDFGNARTEFAVAERELQKLEGYDATFPTLEASTVRIICVAGALKEAADYLQESAEAAEQGNYDRAREMANKAQESANKCNLGSE